MATRTRSSSRRRPSPVAVEAVAVEAVEHVVSEGVCQAVSKTLEVVAVAA